MTEPAKTYTLRNDETGESWTLPAYSGSLGPDVIDVRQLYRQAGVFTYDPGLPRPPPAIPHHLHRRR